MKLSPKQLQEVFDIIEMNHLIFIGQVVGLDTLTPDDKKILQRFGVDLEMIATDYSDLEQSFYWGRLSQILQNQSLRIKYNDFKEYLRRGQYIPLNTTEQYALQYVKQTSYAHIKGLGDRIKQDVNGIITENDPLLRYSYEEVIRSSAERTIIERDSLQNMVLEIGHRTGDWQRDLGRIAATETQNAYQYGRAEQIKRESGGDQLVYKNVFEGACRHCIRLYLTDGIGSQPKLFKLKDLQANGTNIGLKTSDWKPVISSTHPWCRCQIVSKLEGYVWDEENEIFSPPKIESEKRKPLGIVVHVGDKIFNV